MRFAAALLAMTVVALLASGSAGAASFPCQRFERQMDRAHHNARVQLIPVARRAAVRALSEANTVVKAQSCASFRYRRVHGWLRREWRAAQAARNRAEADGQSSARPFGRIRGLYTPIALVEAAAHAHGLRLRPIRRAGDE
jgi:hypothetical protein